MVHCALAGTEQTAKHIWPSLQRSFKTDPSLLSDVQFLIGSLSASHENFFFFYYFLTYFIPPKNKVFSLFSIKLHCED